MVLKFRIDNKEAPVLESLFNKVAGLQAIKKRLQYRCLPVIDGKVLRAAFFVEHLWCLLLNV